MHLATHVTCSLNRYNLQGWKPVKKAILLADRQCVPLDCEPETLVFVLVLNLGPGLLYWFLQIPLP